LLLKGRSLTSAQIVLLGAHIPSMQAMDIVHEYLAREKDLRNHWYWAGNGRERKGNWGARSKGI